MRFIIDNADHRKASEIDIVNLEHLIGLYLPDEYKRFLMSCTGGQPLPYSCPINDGAGKDGIAELFSIHQLNKSIQYWGNPSEVGYLCIGCSSASNAFLMSLEEYSLGEIFFWSFIEEDIEPPTFNHLCPVAKNIDELIDSLFWKTAEDKLYWKDAYDKASDYVPES